MKPLLWDAINPFTGQPFTWDDPNLRWGSPSYYLEPGDPGFVPYATTPSQPKKKGKKMKHQAYYPTRSAEQVQWLENFAAKIGGYAAALALDAAVVTDIVKDCRWIIYIIGPWITAVRAWNLACTQAAKEAQTGTGGAVALPVFTPPALPAGTVARDEGGLTRIFDLVAAIKEIDACGESLCTDLRIVGPESGPPDFAALAPQLTLEISGNAVKIGWGWLGYGKWLDQCELQVDRGQGWQTLTFDTTPDYIDSHPFPATVAQWKYRGIYRVDDVQVGQWSAVVGIAIGG